MKYAEVNGQIWVRTNFPEGERYQRLVRAPKSPRNTATLEKLKESGDVFELDRIECL